MDIRKGPDMDGDYGGEFLEVWETIATFGI